MTEPSTELLRRVARVLDRVLELPAGERGPRIEAECGDDQELLVEVRSALGSEAEGGGFLEGVELYAGDLLQRLADELGEPAPGPADRGGELVAGRYRLVRRLGVGGMGEVWEAWDNLLDRKLALKFLRAREGDREQRRRLLTEARAASGLEHPGICTVYEVGETAEAEVYLAMALCDGPTLGERMAREPLPPDAALGIAGELCEALEAAHSAGVIHRDVKPSNVVAPRAGPVRLLDFGIARGLAGVAGASSGALAGTPAYMAPERLQGLGGDERADLWSVGVLVYEMVAGRHPFPGADGEPSLAAIVECEPPRWPTGSPLPESLRGLLGKALAKRPEDRFQTAREMAVALAEVRQEIAVPRPAAGGEPPRSRPGGRTVLRTAVVAVVAGVLVALGLALLSERAPTTEVAEVVRAVAVLPLEDLSPEGDAARLAEGMTDELISQIGEFSGLQRVISRTSAMSYKGSQLPLAEIGRQLGVDAVVEGSVARIGPRVRVLVRLMGLTPERQLWSGSYRRDVADILTLNGEIARAVAREIRLSLTAEEQERLGRRRRVDPAAYEAYLEGRYQLHGGGSDRAASVTAFQRAIAIDPESARAWAGLAEAYPVAAPELGLPPREALRRARDAAARAVELDPELALSWAALMKVRLQYEWNWAAAGEAIRRALAIQPNSAEARHHHAWYLALTGRAEEAVAEMRVARHLDPRSLAMANQLAIMLYIAGRDEEAIEVAQEPLDLRPDLVPALRVQGLALARAGRVAEGVDRLERAAKLARRGNRIEEALACVYAMAGREEEARRIVAELAEVGVDQEFNVATIHACLGDADRAFSWLDRALAVRSHDVTWIATSRPFAPLRDDPRYERVLREVGLWSLFPGGDGGGAPEADGP